MSRNDQIEALIGGNASVEYQRDGFRRTSTRAPTPHPQERLMDSRKRSRDEFENPEPRAENGYQHRQTNEPGGWSFARTLKWLASSASSFLPVRTDISLKKVGYGDLKQMVRNQDYSLSRQAAELQELEKRLQRKESILDKHIREIGIQTWLLADRKAICDRQAQTIDEQANEVRSCKKEARAKDAEIQHLGQVLLEVKAEHSRQVRGVGDKETIIQQLRQNLQKAQAEQSQQDQTLRKLQESAASRLEPAGWTQDDDEAVRRKFALLDKSVQKWSKKYNIGSLDFMSHANLDEKARLQQTWSIFARSIEVPGDLLDPEMATKAPQLLLTGWLSYYVYDKIFDQPFFFLDNRLPSSGGGGISSRGFEKGQETHRGMANLMKDMLDEFTDCMF